MIDRIKIKKIKKYYLSVVKDSSKIQLLKKTTNQKETEINCCLFVNAAVVVSKMHADFPLLYKELKIFENRKNM